MSFFISRGLKRFFAWDAWLACFFVLIYLTLLYYIYIEKLRRWDYLGFPLGPSPVFALLFSVVLILIPLFLLRRRIQQASSYFAWCIYFFVYIPGVLFPVLQWLSDDVFLLISLLCCSFLLILGFIRSSSIAIKIRVPVHVFWLGFWVIYLLLNGYSLAIFGGSISFADIVNVYDQRTLAGDLADGTLVGYATGILSGCFNPFLMSVGLLHRRPVYFTMGAIGQIFVYTTFAMKSTLLSIVIILVLYLLCIRGGRVRWRGVAIFSVASVLIPLVVGLFIDEDASVLYENIAAIVYMRTYGMVGALIGIYYDFFSLNPQTYYSHINLVGMFVTYPYQASIGEVIGASMGLEMNANANFFATDGIAAAGLFGLLLIGAVVGLTLRFMDSLVPRENVPLLCGAAAPILMSLANSSFFTTLLTSGLMLLILLCALWRPEMAYGLSLARRPAHFMSTAHIR
ncbi:hypothetical protein [Rhodoferax sp. U11-2br]|uniref:hypothetical protein n=1 Tax=Rhodoferax sp. U11-2br TaxID=2838878 RepID=UPI001BE62522|nr:hypothetical protein [Rhodoferax sp. U11-2br]MBT3068362.1 hypothetical protein [Rhodoferax sp. U11-2br]